MPRFARLLLALSMLLGVASALPSRAADAYAGYVNEHAYVDTPAGRMFVQYWRPKVGKVPTILSISPYRYVYTRANPSDPIKDGYSDRYLPKGYGRAYADLIGTGLSDGCYDYGGKNEAISGAAVVEWLAAQPWSTGKIGMIGTSYDGASQLEVATLAPPHLAAIVPQEPVSSWYHYNYDHGVLYNSTDEESGNEDSTGYLVGTPDLFDFVLGRTPNIDPTLTPQQRLDNLSGKLNECDNVEHETRGHGVDTAYTEFWKERDWSLRAKNVKAAVLFQHGWDDNNTKTQQFQRFFANLTNAAEKRAILGQWTHTDVFDGGAAGVSFPVSRKEYLDAFFARWLKGKPASVLAGFPKILSQANDGTFRTTLPIGVKKTVIRIPSQGATFANTGSESEAVTRRAKTTSSTPNVWMHTLAVVRQDTRLTGTATATVTAASDGLRGQLDGALIDVAPDSSMALVGVGMLDLRYRSDLGVATSLTPGKTFTATISFTPQDYVVKAGHRLVITLAGSESVWGVPDPEVGQTITLADVTLALPLVPARLATVKD